MIVDYRDLYKAIRQFLISKRPSSTVNVTTTIKDFFVGHYPDYIVLCSGNLHYEYMVDISVLRFNPKDVLEQRSLAVKIADTEVLIAVESELGGTGGSSAYGVMKNVVEDYLKLLMIGSHYRVLFFTSLPYKGEGPDHVTNRVETLRQLYQLSSKAEKGALLVHLWGTQPRSGQVQAHVDPASIRGFVIEPGGDKWTELQV